MFFFSFFFTSKFPIYISLGSFNFIVFFPIDCNWIHHTHTHSHPPTCLNIICSVIVTYIHIIIHNLVIYKIYTIKVCIFFRIYYLTLVNQLVIFNKTLLGIRLWAIFGLSSCFVLLMSDPDLTVLVKTHWWHREYSDEQKLPTLNKCN